MKNFLLQITLLLLLFTSCQQTDKPIPAFPQPTDGTQIRQGEEETEENGTAREAWFELMHRHAPGISWQQLEYQTAMERHQQRRHQAPLRSENEILADGALTGRWIEKGNSNQAGSVYETLYDVTTDKIYTVSAGGTLWRGNRTSTDWQVVNQDLTFSRHLLEMITLPDGTKRMLALVNRAPHFSDDMGLTWEASNGVEANDNWGGPEYTVISDNGSEIYCLSKPSFFENYALFRSADYGVNFEKIFDLQQNNGNTYSMMQPANGTGIYIAEKITAERGQIKKWNAETNELDLIINSEDIDFGDQRANLIGHTANDTTRFYFYGTDNVVKQSIDEGQTWTVQGFIPEAPWRVGLYVSNADPNLLLSGGLDCYKSYDAGQSWELQNNWWEYYDDVEGKLHADMMTFNEAVDQDGNLFYLISNHGGLSISYDKMVSTDNIGTSGLNVNQFYDVRTDPLNSFIVYAGSQDQGFQRGIDVNEDLILTMDQVISGDYGHLAFSDNNQRLWTVYPGGAIYYYNNPQNGFNSAYYELASENETVWIPPLMESPDSDKDEVYLAGGNAEGGSGSYIIRLTHNNGTINATNLPFNFLPESGGTVSAISTSPLNPDFWYAATTNGRFFNSEDGGQTWEQSLNFVPDGHYLYGQAILPSALDENVIYYGGSGYNNPAVYVSVDNGISFDAMNEGLPPTLVFELVANEDESLIFAATEAGPYVFVVADGQWYDMHGMGAPAQTYWSVEYLSEKNTVRFGTYGRGIWDFKIEETTNTVNPELLAVDFSTFPNPVTEQLRINIPVPTATKLTITVVSQNGKNVFDNRYNIALGSAFSEVIDLQNIPPGAYVVQVTNGKNQSVKQIIKI